MAQIHAFVRLPDESLLTLASAVATRRYVDFSLLPERINYALTDTGLECTIELGAVVKRPARVLSYIEYKLSLQGEV